MFIDIVIPVPDTKICLDRPYRDTDGKSRSLGGRGMLQFLHVAVYQCNVQEFQKIYTPDTNYTQLLFYSFIYSLILVIYS